MAAKGYSSRAQVGDELGVVLTALQEVQVDALLEQAEAVVDRLTATQWLETSPATAESYVLTGDVLTLVNTPVTAVTAVTARAMTVGATAETLTAGSDYELIDAARGTLLIPGRTGQYATVSYTFSAPVPADVTRMTTLLVRHWMLPRLLGTTAGAIDTVSIADVSVKYTTGSVGGSASSDIPDEVLALAAQARKPIFV